MTIINLIISSIDKWFEYSFYKLLKPFIVALPGTMIACYQTESLRTSLPSLISWIDDNIKLLVWLSFMIPVLIGVEEIIKKYAKKIKIDFTSEGYALFLRAIDQPVEKKMNRFLSYAYKNSGNNNKTYEQIFNEITQPEIQVAEIIRSIHIFFEGLATIFGYNDQDDHNKIEFKTALIILREGVPVKNWCYFPENAPIEKTLLDDKKSLTVFSVKEKATLIVEDIKAEKLKKKSKISKSCTSDYGSAICYPIRCSHMNNVPLAIRIVATKKFFEQRKKKVYDKIFERFSKRILIEYALNELKK